MANTFHLMISTPQKIYVDDEVYQVTMPTLLGRTGILPNHANIVGIIVPGKIKILYPDNKDEISLINQGIFTFSKNKLTILSDFFQKGGIEVDEEAFNNIKHEIEHSMKKTNLDENTKKSISIYIRKMSTQIKKAKQKR